MESIWEYRALLIAGTFVTVKLAIASLALSVLFGLLGASAKLSNNRTLRRLGAAYTTLIRGIPELVLIKFLFYSGQQLLNDLGDATGLWGVPDS